MRGARLLLGTAVAGNRMAAATESEAINVAERILLRCGRAVRTSGATGTACSFISVFLLRLGVRIL